MSFKHSNENSPILKSLEKIAQEKGLIKNDPLKKLAAKPMVKKADVVPTENLMENIFKLCAGLTAQGLVKDAQELETTYFQYKQAQTLYNAHNETGEDVLQFAHPKGSHKLEDVASDEAVFEDLLDKHTKFLEMIEKKPTGKLSNANQIIKSVKIVLSDDNSSNLDKLYQQATSNFQKFKQIYSAMSTKSGGTAEDNEQFFGTIQSALDEKRAYESPDLDGRLINSLNDFQNSQEPGFFSTPTERQVWHDEVLPLTVIAKKYALAFQTNVQSIHKEEAEAKTKSAVEPFEPAPRPAKSIEIDTVTDLGTELINILKGYQSLQVVAKNSLALQYTKDEMAEIQTVINDYKSAESNGQLDTKRVSLEAQMQEKQKEVSDFAKQMGIK